MKRDTMVSLPFMVMGLVFCTCLIASNILETKAIQMGDITLTCGVLCFPLSYILNDCIVEVWGFRKARFIIWCAFLMNFLVVMFGQIAVMLPAADFWKENEQHFNFVFGLAPRIAVASFAAFLLGSFVNAYVLSRMKIHTGGKHFSLRAITSTLLGEGMDSLVFFPLAFGGLIPTREVCKLMVLQIFIKTAYEILILPITIRVVKYVKRIEKTDVYDHGETYNPFKINKF